MTWFIFAVELLLGKISPWHQFINCSSRELFLCPFPELDCVNIGYKPSGYSLPLAVSACYNSTPESGGDDVSQAISVPIPRAGLCIVSTLAKPSGYSLALAVDASYTLHQGAEAMTWFIFTVVLLDETSPWLHQFINCSSRELFLYPFPELDCVNIG
ncbi:hypothetical protein J6590_052933 [Homalodisca vitripennis]|nr:hypothetical protein J6590_052933 [Homalodisca vitripennis]